MSEGTSPDADGAVFGLEGRVAVVAGATSCGSRHAAVLLARAGARVAILGPESGAGCRTARRIAEEGGACVTVPADISDAAEGARAIAGVVEAHGTVDVLVNDVARHRQLAPAHRATRDELTLAVSAMMLMVRHVEPLMRRAGGGAIVNVASAADDAVVRISHAMALQHGEAGIRVNCVIPDTGPDTGLAVLFLSSVLAKHVSGTVIRVAQAVR